MSTSQSKDLAAAGRMLISTSAPASPMRRTRMPISVRFALRSPRKGYTYTNPHPLEVWIVVDGERAHLSAFWNRKKLMVDPADWRVSKQTSARRGDPVNQLLSAMKAYIEGVHKSQLDLGGIPTVKSVKRQSQTGQAPEWSKLHGWVYAEDKEKRRDSNQYAHCISGDSLIDEAYEAYIIHLQRKEGTTEGLSHITLGRWQRGLLLLNEFAKQTEQALPKASHVTVGWAKRFHSWMQKMPRTKYQHNPISEGQASRFVHKVSNVLTWMIEEDWLTRNPIARVSWPRYEDKEVLSLEPEHVNHLLHLDWKGTKGAALWWFCLMCCTGMDYPDAVAYARDRKAFEVKGREGLKIVGRRKKPPHGEFHLPFLPEVELLFSKYPTGPRNITGHSVNRYTDQIEEELGIEWRITNKTARKTFGFLMREAGHQIADVSRMLGHSTIVTTERHYVKVKGSSIDRAMRRVNVSISELAGNRSGMEGQSHD